MPPCAAEVLINSFFNYSFPQTTENKKFCRLSAINLFSDLLTFKQFDANKPAPVHKPITMPVS